MKEQLTDGWTRRLETIKDAEESRAGKSREILYLQAWRGKAWGNGPHPCPLLPGRKPVIETVVIPFTSPHPIHTTCFRKQKGKHPFNPSAERVSLKTWITGVCDGMC